MTRYILAAALAALALGAAAIRGWLQRRATARAVAAGTVPWSVAEVAYAAYAARYGREQSIERMAERGGFGHEEMDLYAPGWHDSFEAAP